MISSSNVLKPVPKEERVYRGLDVFLIWAGGNTCLATIFTGGLIAPELGLFSLVLIILIAATFGGFLLGLVGIIGSREGLPTMVLTRRVIGKRASYVASMLNAFQLIGWTSILLYVSGEALATALEAMLPGNNLLTNPVLWVIIIGVIESAYTAIGPERWVWYQRVAVTTLLIVLIYEAYALINYSLTVHTSVIVPHEVSSSSLLWAFDMVLATAVSWAPLVADYARFSKSKTGAAMGTWWGYGLTSYALYGLGALAAVATGAYLGDPTQVLLKLGLSTVLLIFVSVSAITTNLLNIYSATVSTLNVFPKVKYIALVTLYGGLTTALAIVPVLMTNFEYFLTYIGVVFVPLTTTLIMHYLMPGGEKGVTEGLVSWIIGAVAGLIISIIYGYGATISSLVTSAATYAILTRRLLPTS
jgi:NCS1 family nucleobase:cation symporter-1